MSRKEGKKRGLAMKNVVDSWYTYMGFSRFREPVPGILAVDEQRRTLCATKTYGRTQL